MSLGSILDMGTQALFGSQSAINVTGNNISNVNTPGYSRQKVQFEEGDYLDSNPGQLGTGVKATQILRQFDDFVEKQYNDKASSREEWSTLEESLKSIESIFNESSSDGISSAVTKFFDGWQQLTQKPDDLASREALLSSARDLVAMIGETSKQLGSVQDQSEDYIKQDVDSINKITQQIADLNIQINVHEVPGQNNANGMRDQRAQLIRDLAEKCDITYLDNGGGNVSIALKSGQTLVDSGSSYTLSYKGPQVTTNLSAGSTFTGDIHYSGADDFEYTLKVEGTSGGLPTYKVSLDGGSTWLRNDDGTVRHFTANDVNAKTTTGDLQVWFDTPASLSQGDSFTITPKSGLYCGATGGEQNVTPETRVDGTQNTRRITGGSLAGLFQVRDNYIGKYKDKLDAFASSLSWEVNRIHSQGTGLDMLSSAISTNAVQDPTIALGSDSSGLAYNTKLQSGSLMMYFYDSSGKQVNLASNALTGYTSTGPASATFDPAVHSLQSVADAMNSSFGAYITASITGNNLQITAKNGGTFAFGADSTGLLAGLGLNTFFSGSSADTLGLSDEVAQNAALVCAGHVNGGNEANTGDNTVAADIAGLQTKKVTFHTFYEGTTSQALSDYYNSLVANIGADTDKATFNLSYHKALAADLDSRQNQVSGVSLDEEMSNLIKFQHSYQAAAKLIMTADQMMQTLLGLKT